MYIGDIVSKAIKEGKWIEISYVNTKEENTFYWISIKDVDLKRKKLYVSIFNDKKSLDTFESWINFYNIKSARIIDFSSYEVPQKLIDKIENNLDECKWLNYDHFNHNILNYYKECNILNSDPSQKEYSLIPGIDLEKLREEKIYKLNEEQIKKIVTDIYHYDLNNKNKNSFFTLGINCLSIDEGKSKYVICYNKLTFDPIKKSILLDKKPRFNHSFLVYGRRHSLQNYINMDKDEFTNNFTKKYNEYQNLLMQNLRPGESINTRPEIMLIQREVWTDLSDTYDIIEEKYYNNEMPVPLKSFFGNITKRNNIRRKEPSLIIYDKRININQMRVIYNALKYPVTYVQGPPGTGKTQTIINVVLSAFYNNKTVLACSSNNKPVDGIIEKLKFEYNGEIIKFPYLRLGNFDDVKRTTKRIYELYKYSTDKTPQNKLLDRIKINNDNNNTDLIKLLNIQEKKLEIEDCLQSSNKLLHSFNGKDSKIIELVKEKVSQLKNELRAIPEITNEEIVSLFNPVKQNYQLSQFLFFKSLQFIKKLKFPRYNELIEICAINDENERAERFNRWTQENSNMKKLVEVFPIIFSTNRSSKRLGNAGFMFDLVIMDEAGQCDIATALLPIAKAESLLLVGDQKQLKPVIILEDQINNELLEKYNVPEKYDYKNYSILDVMRSNDNISKSIMLRYHYRCGKKIIGFSNQRYYNNSLDLSSIPFDGELKVLDVKNKTLVQRNAVNEEANLIVDYIKRNDIHDAYIITPFVNQKELLKKKLIKNNIFDIDCGTIHSLQGAEKDTIILSTALSEKTSKNTFKWIKDNYELINVAVTRAKNKLIIAADMEILNILSDKKDDLYNLVQYAKSNGQTIVQQNESIKIEIGKSNNSLVEDEFFKTISHFCSCHKTFEASRNVKLGKVIKSGLTPQLSRMEFDLVLYEKRFMGTRKPVIAFEVNGGEHFGLRSRELSDKSKIEICKKNDIKLIIIPNSFVKAYEYIADIIMASKDRNRSIQESLFID